MEATVLFEEWAGRYVAVTNDLHYSREGDAQAADEIAALMAKRAGPTVDNMRFVQLLSQQRVFVLANGPTLEEEIKDHQLKGTVIAADGATPRVIKQGTFPELIVTDLDGDVGAIVKANARGAIVLVHAHADNRHLLAKCIPLFEGPVVASVQCAPPAGTRNFGGLTDGDRAVFLADHFGASEIVMAGFDFGLEEAKLTPSQHRKFIWGALLIASLDNPGVKFFDEYEAGQAANPIRP